MKPLDGIVGAVASLLKAVSDAGGDIGTDRLLSMTMSEFLDIASKNDIRFTHEPRPTVNGPDNWESPDEGQVGGYWVIRSMSKKGGVPLFFAGNASEQPWRTSTMQATRYDEYDEAETALKGLKSKSGWHKPDIIFVEEEE